MIIAVDGPTASGKGTIATALARHFDLPHLDTGLLYRAAGRQVALTGGDADNPQDAQAACTFPESLLDDPALRTEETGALASRVSIHPEVRQALYERQRAFATQPGGAVLDGRDIGTVIAPEADIKFFITASQQERARRRYEEMRARALEVTLAQIEAELARRDARDCERAHAPLRQAEGAIRIDTTTLPRPQAIGAAIAQVESALR